jgi:hypothetical protein
MISLNLIVRLSDLFDLDRFGTIHPQACESITSESSLSKTLASAPKPKRTLSREKPIILSTQFFLPEGGSIIAQRFIGG